MTRRSLYPSRVEVRSVDLQFTEDSKSELLRQISSDAIGHGPVSGLTVTVNSTATTRIDVALGRGYAQNGELCELTSAQSSIALRDYTNAAVNNVVLTYTETQGSTRAHETDGTVRATRATGNVAVAVYSAAEYAALQATSSDMTQVALDRTCLIATVSANGLGNPLTGGDITPVTAIQNAQLKLSRDGSTTVTGQIQPAIDGQMFGALSGGGNRFDIGAQTVNADTVDTLAANVTNNLVVGGNTSSTNGNITTATGDISTVAGNVSCGGIMSAGAGIDTAGAASLGALTVTTSAQLNSGVDLNMANGNIQMTGGDITVTSGHVQAIQFFNSPARSFTHSIPGCAFAPGINFQSHPARVLQNEYIAADGATARFVASGNYGFAIPVDMSWPVNLPQLTTVTSFGVETSTTGTWSIAPTYALRENSSASPTQNTLGSFTPSNTGGSTSTISSHTIDNSLRSYSIVMVNAATTANASMNYIVHRLFVTYTLGSITGA